MKFNHASLGSQVVKARKYKSDWFKVQVEPRKGERKKQRTDQRNGKLWELIQTDDLPVPFLDYCTFFFHKCLQEVNK